MLPGVKPRWVVCEDGTEYHERFVRFLGGEFEFVPASDAEALWAAAGEADGVILDLDFRLTPAERLIDERGDVGNAGSEDARRRLSAAQGILILRALRARGHRLRVLLCADLDDEQAAFLVASLAPLQIVPSREGLAQTAERMRSFSGPG